MTGHSVRGFRGRLFWWVVWWPIGLLVSMLWLILALLGEGDDAFGKPRRVIWRDSSRRAHLVFRGVADEYRVLDGSWDPRLVAALLGLHQSYDPSEGSRRERLVRPVLRRTGGTGAPLPEVCAGTGT